MFSFFSSRNDFLRRTAQQIPTAPSTTDGSTVVGTTSSGGTVTQSADAARQQAAEQVNPNPTPVVAPTTPTTTQSGSTQVPSTYDTYFGDPEPTQYYVHSPDGTVTSTSSPDLTLAGSPSGSWIDTQPTYTGTPPSTEAQVVAADGTVTNTSSPDLTQSAVEASTGQPAQVIPAGTTQSPSGPTPGQSWDSYRQQANEQVNPNPPSSTTTAGGGTTTTGGGTPTNYSLPDTTVAMDPARVAELQALIADAQSNPNAVIPPEAFQEIQQLLVNQNELARAGVSAIGAQTPIDAARAGAAQAATPEQLQAQQVQAALVGEAEQMRAATGGVSRASLITDPVTGQLRPESAAEAVVRNSPPEAYIREQLNTLMAGMSDGEVPAWAQPAVAAAESQLAARGMSNSSVARTELFNAIIQSAMPIAQGDAATAQQTFLANLNNEQQAVMFNAAQNANMDMQNASYLQKAQATNAQAFLQMDFANMTNEQRTREINQQAKQQALLTDTAAKNAARQFNATSAMQTEQFMTSLTAQVNESNAARRQATSQFNVNAENAVRQFNAATSFQRDQFNAQNAAAVEQSNVNWRRQVNTINTANQNAVNQAEAMNAFNLSNQALTFMWQEYRDSAEWAFNETQNEAERATRVAIAAMGNEAAAAQMEADMWGEIGSAAVTVVGDWLLS